MQSKFHLSMFNKKLFYLYSVASLYLSLVFCFYYFNLAGIQKNFIAEYINFNAYFSPINALFYIFLLFVLSIYWLGLGKFILGQFKIHLPISFTISIGLIFFNIAIFPLFFLNLVTKINLFVLFLLLSLIAVKGLFAKNNLEIKIKYQPFFVIISIFLFLPQLLNALSPVNFSESYGDIANTYLSISMNFAKSSGAVQNHLLGVALTQFDNFELISSTLIVLSNPEIIKLFGLLLFFLTYWILNDIIRMIFSKNISWITLLLLTIPFFSSSRDFSFAHPRIYVMFLSSLSLYLILLAKKKKEQSYFLLTFILTAVLIATSYQGLLSGIILIFILLLNINIRNIVINYKKFLPFFIFFLIISLAFPVWISLKQGSPFPLRDNFNKILNLSVNKNFSNEYIVERISLLSQSQNNHKILSWFFGLVKIIYEQLSFTTLLLFVAPFLIKNSRIRDVLLFYMINCFTLLLMFPNSIDGGGRARFIWIYSPVLIFIIAAVYYELISKFNFFLRVKQKNLVKVIDKNVFTLVSNLVSVFIVRFFVFKTVVFVFKIVPQISKYLYFQTWSFLLFLLIFSFLLGKLINYIFPKKLSWGLTRLTISNSAFLFLIFSYIFQRHNLYNLPIIKSFLLISPGIIQVILLMSLFSTFDILLDLKKKTKVFLVNLTYRLIPIIFKYSVVILVVSSIFKNLDLIYKELLDSGQFSKQLMYICQKTKLDDYLEYRSVAVSKILNANFSSQDKILYLFQAQGIYTKPILYQANVTGVGSIIYRTNDKQKILNTLDKEGIKYLAIDNKWGISNDVSLSIPADINTPIFEPDFLIRHFILINSDIQSFYLFKIINKEISEKEIETNYENIRKSGFLTFLFYGVNNKSKAIRLKANPYSIDILQNKLKKMGDAIYPYPGDYFQKCQYCCYSKN